MTVFIGQKNKRFLPFILLSDVVLTFLDSKFV